MLKTALLQNSVGVGGRSKVLAEAIRTLSNYSQSLDLHTLSTSSDINRFLDHYKLNDAGVTGINHRGSSVPGTVYQQVILNIGTRSELSKYDLVFNSNNCVRFLPAGPRYLHYIHFPTSQIPQIDPKYDHLSYRIASVPLVLMSAITTPNPDGQVFANSKFTLKHAQEAYSLSSEQVLYPPAVESIQFSGFTGNGVVSVGSFNKNKRQLLQLRMAKQFPETEFRIIGRLDSEQYYENCQKYITNNGLNNVTLLTDVSDQQLHAELQHSRVFIHTMKNERFGIAPVEAINHGCIPVVHNSGGLREVVPNSAFRFDNRPDFENILNAVLLGKSPVESRMRAHIEQFTKTKFTSILSDHIQI